MREMDKQLFFALRAKDWESLKDVGSPAYQYARFAVRLSLGLLSAHILNTISLVILLTISF